MSSDVVIEAKSLGKAYAIFKRPEDRLKQLLSRGRRRYYEEYWALRDVNLTVRRGETVALIGHNGAGKSTFLQLLCGTLAASTGQIAVAGRVGALLELGAGFNPEFTGRENMTLAASVLGLSEREIAEKAQAIIDFAEIGDFLDQPVKLYSSGMYARLAFAVMAHSNPDVLIVDEILSVGDAAFQQKCMRFIRRFRARGTLLFVSHDMAAVLNLCDRAVWLDTGTVRMVGSAKEVCASYQAAVHGSAVNVNAFRIGGSRTVENEPPLPIDPREGLLREAGLAPKIEVFAFDPDAPWFGQRGGTIENVRIVDDAGMPIDSFNGGEEITLEVDAVAHQVLSRPIIGFLVKDRLGQNLFGDNTFLTYAERGVSAPAGARVRASFTFRVPFMPPGTYAVTVALADGTQAEHVQHHWVDEALMFQVISPNSAKGLLGIPMREIRLEVTPG
jgi:lipopolysaccharide transport system ATP-binding protein